MEPKSMAYLAIDLKSFYASVECMDRGLDPLTTNLVVADVTRTEKTICLAVSPALKAYGIPGRARLFEVVEKVKEINRQRRYANGGQLSGESTDALELKAHPEYALSYLAAPPHMSHYMEVSSRVYEIYLKYIAPNDIHVYSIDEVFIDVTNYLSTYHVTAHELARRMIGDILQAVGITATAGIGTNLYLAKIAMDIQAKHTAPDAEGVRIAELDEMSYRRLLWSHQPLTDFWRVGHGYAKKLMDNGLFTMGDIARCSIGGPYERKNEELLYHLFGVNAELLIDHAWGWEPCTIAAIKAYRPASNSIGSGQVLHCAYPNAKARLIVREMSDLLAMDLFAKGLVTDQLVLNIGYDIENLTDPAIRILYKGPVTADRYGRQVPKPAHGSQRLEQATSSVKQITDAAMVLFDRITDKNLLVRRVNITAMNTVSENELPRRNEPEQLDMFTNYAARAEKQKQDSAEREREKKKQQAILEIQQKFGKNAILKGMNLEEGATTVQRNKQIGGHKA